MSAYVNRLLIKNLQGGSSKEDIQKSINESEAIVSKENKNLEILKKKLKERPKLVVRYT